MKAGKIVSIAMFSACLAACGGGSGGGNAVRPVPPPAPAPAPAPPEPEPAPPEPVPEPPAPIPVSSLSGVPEQYWQDVSDGKTLPLTNEDHETFIIDGKTGEFNFSDLPNGITELPIGLSYQTEQGVAATASGTLLMYQQPYSIVIGETWTQDSGGEFEADELGVFYSNGAFGFFTPAANLDGLVAQNMSFNYTGIALDGTEQGTLAYTMNFGLRQGFGSISGIIRTGDIELNLSDTFDHYGDINFGSGQATVANAPSTSEFKYVFSFFGPNAEEIAGEVYDISKDGIMDGSEIIFAGER